jgi:phage-related tail protein
MSEVTPHGLLPAEHRALRELHATARQVRNHWRKLATRLGGAPAAVLEQGAAAADELLQALEARIGAQHDLHGQPAAQAVGARLAGFRGVSDLMLERNQAFRTALLDLQHVTTLLGYLGALARSRGDEDLAAWHEQWEQRLRTLEERVRAAVKALAHDPESAIAPADESALGRAGAKLGAAVGTVGEAIDSSALGRLARRRAT